jgi:predicted nucleic acid-binding protein
VTYLLDANVLIALTVEEHEHHERSTAWAATVDRFAICPLVEGALVRFLLRLGESATTAAEVVRRIHQMAACDFWADSISYAKVAVGHVVSHRQVSGAYLVSLARANAATVATLDEQLAKSVPDRTYLLPILAGPRPSEP